MVNGKPVIDQGQHTGALVGRVIKRNMLGYFVYNRNIT